MKSKSLFTVLAALGSAAASVQAAGITLVNPSFYGQPNSTMYTWNSYPSTSGPNAPQVTNQPAGTANYFDRTASTDDAMIVGASSPTAGGRIYSFDGVVHPEIDVPLPNLGATGIMTIELQAQVTGSPLDLPTLLASAGGSNYTPTSITTTTQSVPTGAPPPAPSDTTEYDYVIVWNNLPATTNYVLTYAASDFSSSQSTVRVDTFSQTPEPTSLASLGLAAAAPLLRRRRLIG